VAAHSEENVKLVLPQNTKISRMAFIRKKIKHVYEKDETIEFCFN